MLAPPQMGGVGRVPEAYVAIVPGREEALTPLDSKHSLHAPFVAAVVVFTIAVLRARVGTPVHLDHFFPTKNGLPGMKLPRPHAMVVRARVACGAVRRDVNGSNALTTLATTAVTRLP